MLDHFVDRPRRPHLARSAGPGRAVRSREYRLGGAANVAHNIVGARRPGRARRRRRRRRGGGAAARASCRAPAIDAGRHRRGPGALHDAKAARRDDAQSAGRADRLRGRRRGRRRARSARSSTRIARAAAARRRDPRLGLPEGRRLARRSRRAAIAAARRARHSAARRSEGPAHRLLRRRDGHHAEPSRGGSGHAHADPHRRRTRARPRGAFRERAPVRERADHARRARHVAARPATAKPSCRPRRARSRTSPARATPSSRRWRSALAAGASLADAARLANRAAGIVVGKFGPATVTLGELAGTVELFGRQPPQINRSR